MSGVVAVVDIDGVVADEGEERVYSEEAGWPYDRCVVIEAGRDLVRGLYKSGVRIVFHTARPAVDRDVTKKWLARHDIPYHELVMGKPLGDVYLDDRSFPTFDPRKVTYEDVGLALLWRQRP